MNDSARAKAWHSFPVLRPDRMILWLPAGLAASLGITRGQQLTAEQWQSPELTRLLSDRQKCNDANGHCTVLWHIKNGWT